MVHQEPDVYIDVTDYIDVKVESFKKHSSQWQEWGKPSKDQGEYLEKLVDMYVHRFREYGRRCGVKYAEAYISKSRLAYAHDLLPVKR